MPLHDHPNMCVFFRMMFGRLNYRSYDKIDEKFQYNQFSLDEYQELIEQKGQIGAKLVNQTILNGPQFMMVRPSHGNVHEFVAEENTCFFDICLPNYTADSLRRITYFKEVTGEAAAEANLGEIDTHKFVSSLNPSSLADKTFELSKKIEGLRIL